MSIRSNTKQGSVLQVSLGAAHFSGCLVIVDEVHEWGVVACIRQADGDVWVRLEWDDLAYIGEAEWF